MVINSPTRLLNVIGMICEKMQPFVITFAENLTAASKEPGYCQLLIPISHMTMKLLFEVSKTVQVLLLIGISLLP